MPQDPTTSLLTSAIYHVPYPDGTTKTLHSMADFYDIIVDFCVVTCIVSMATDPAYQEIVHGESEPSIEVIGPLVDALIPDESQAGSLFTFVAFDLGLFTEEPEDYDKDNSHAPAALVYENLYRETVNYIQEHWQEITLLVRDNLCEVCWKHQWRWLWYPFTSSSLFTFSSASSLRRPPGALGLCNPCRQQLEQGATLSFAIGVQHYQANGRQASITLM